MKFEMNEMPSHQFADVDNGNFNYFMQIIANDYFYVDASGKL